MALVAGKASNDMLAETKQVLFSGLDYATLVSRFKIKGKSSADSKVAASAG